MHSGIGPSQVNALLSSLNIPTVITRTLQNRQNELGTVMEKVAEDTKRSSLHEEIQATLENEGTDELTVSVDAGWQKRGSVRSFDSIFGHGKDKLLHEKSKEVKNRTESQEQEHHIFCRWLPFVGMGHFPPMSCQRSKLPLPHQKLQA